MHWFRFVVAAAVAACSTFAFAQAPDASAAPDPDTLFKGRMGGTFGKDMKEVMPNAKRVALAAFKVAFVVDNKVSAQVRATYLPGGIDHSGARSSFQVNLTGVSPATMQLLTDRAYAEFTRQMQASGREVVAMDDMKEFFASVGATPTSAAAPYTKEANGQTLLFFTPKGMPLVFTHFDQPWGDRGFMDLTNYRRLEEYSGKWDAAVMSPTIVVNFARMSSSGNRSALTQRAAETGAELAITVAGLSSFWGRTTEFRNGMAMGGDQGSFKMEQPVASPLEFGTMQVTQQDDNSALKTSLDIFGKAMALSGKGRGIANLGGAATSSTKAVAQTSDAAYSAAADDALKRTAVALGGWFKKYPAAGVAPAAAAAAPAIAVPGQPAAATAPVAAADPASPAAPAAPAAAAAPAQTTQ